MYLNEKKELTPYRLDSDEKILNKLGMYLPEIERRTAYYKLMHEGIMYHVFNAEKIVS